jgi:putative FmdB family regulatory protein
VPIYEFVCERCGTRFEELVAAEMKRVACPDCGAEQTKRVYSAQGAPFKIIKAPGEARRQERKNSQLRERTKAAFRQARRRSADRRRTGR